VSKIKAAAAAATTTTTTTTKPTTIQTITNVSLHS